MMSETTEFDETEGYRRRLKIVIVARVLSVLVLAYASAIWSSEDPGFIAREGISPGLAVFLFTALSLSVIYYLLIEFVPNLRLQVLVQMVMDVFLITWLLLETGDATSPYFPLYILLIGVCGGLLNSNSTVFISVFCGLCYTVLSVTVSQSVFYSLSGSEPPSRMAQIVALNDVALLVVGLLAARLSERRRIQKELVEKTASFEDLNVLHERILESVDSGLITTDLNGKIFGFNRAAERITGRRAGDMIGQSVYDLFGDEIRSSVALCLRPVEGEGFEIGHFEAGVVRGAGTEPQSRTAVVCSPAPLTTKDGERYGMILSFQDITRIRTMEESLRRSDRLAAVGRMAAGLAHEVRNPLGSMGSALQYLQDKVKSDTPEESLLRVVLKESERLNGIISDFLSYARPKESGLEHIDIREPVTETITLLKLSPEMTTAHSVEFHGPDEPLIVLADEEKLKQVFWNLLRNALQAMPDGGKLLITAEQLKGVHVRIVIEDDGVGMDREQLEHLWEPFYEHSRGTGLGMPIVHRIILDHGGRIDVFSKPDEGTRVIIELPQ